MFRGDFPGTAVPLGPEFFKVFLGHLQGHAHQFSVVPDGLFQFPGQGGLAILFEVNLMKQRKSNPERQTQGDGDRG